MSFNDEYFSDQKYQEARDRAEAWKKETGAKNGPSMIMEDGSRMSEFDLFQARRKQQGKSTGMRDDGTEAALTGAAQRFVDSGGNSGQKVNAGPAKQVPWAQKERVAAVPGRQRVQGKQGESLKSIAERDAALNNHNAAPSKQSKLYQSAGKFDARKAMEIASSGGFDPYSFKGIRSDNDGYGVARRNGSEYADMDDLKL